MKKLSKMKDKLNIAIEFTEKLKKSRYLKNIYQVVLFGSVATGEDNKTSDIDIAIIHNMKDKFKLMNVAILTKLLIFHCLVHAYIEFLSILYIHPQFCRVRS